MSVAETVIALVLAFVAMYGLGIPLAWLLPAPDSSPWVHRIAVGPVYAILLTSVVAWGLRMIGIPLHPLQLGALVVGAWAVAWVRTGSRWQVRTALRHAGAPALMVGTSGILWVASLVGYGLYLPNRDFKNHAYWVAQVASARTSDSRVILRSSPLDPMLESRGGYPLGLHTLLGWSLPTTDWESVGITAAAAVLATSISLPLAMVTLSRMWDPDRLLGILAGFAVIALPGVTSAFRIGAVPMMVGTGLYAASLAVLWLWLRSPSRASMGALAAVGSGLLVLHVAEAVGLALVMLACIPGWLWRRRRGLGPRSWMAMFAVATGALLVGFLYVRPLLGVFGGSFVWDVEENTFGPVTAPLVALMRSVSNRLMIGQLWVPLVLAAIWIAYKRRLSLYPMAALAPSLGLAVVAGAAFVPDWVRPLAAPWYGAIGRVSLMTAPPAILMACLTLVALIRHAGGLAVDGRGRLIKVVSVALAAAMLVLPVSDLLPERRGSLFAKLAGAGDTRTLARELRDRLDVGQSVLTFEGDGGPLLFAFARVPIQTGGSPYEADLAPLYRVAIMGLGRLSDPDVADAMDALGIGYIAIGTTSAVPDDDGGLRRRQPAGPAGAVGGHARLRHGCPCVPAGFLMTREFAGALSLAGLLVAFGVAGAARSGIEGRAGQIIFVPMAEFDQSAVRAGPTLEVWSCEPGQAGLTVTGHIDPTSDNPVIAVTGGMERDPGARVGTALAMDGDPSQFGEVGDFVAVLPWATKESLFAVRLSQSEREYGPSQRCPGTGSG